MPDRLEHFLQNPKALSCGDRVCSKCIPDNYDEIVCRHCDQKNTIDLSKQSVVKVFQAILNANLKDLCGILENAKNKLEGKVVKHLHSFRIILN